MDSNPLRRFHWKLAFIPLCLLTLITSTAEESEYQFEVVYTADLWQNMDGGLDRKAAYLDNLDIIFDWSLDAENSLHFHLLHNNGNTFSDKVGDAQVISNIDNTDMRQIMEFWWQTQRNNHTFKFGLTDLNADFDAIEAAGLMLNSSHGIGPDYSQSGVNGPSIFPFSSLTFYHHIALDEQWSVQWSVRDGTPMDPDDPRAISIDISSGDLLLSAETNWIQDDLRLGFGIWRYTESTETLDANGQEDNNGWYGIAEYGWDGTQESRWNSWLRYGQADDDINPFKSYLGVGLVWSGFNQNRPDDQLGIAMARANTSDTYRGLVATSESNETNIELTYYWHFTDTLQIQPDIQYVLNPGIDSSVDNAIVIGIRFSWTVL